MASVSRSVCARVRTQECEGKKDEEERVCEEYTQEEVSKGRKASEERQKAEREGKEG